MLRLKTLLPVLAALLIAMPAAMSAAPAATPSQPATAAAPVVMSAGVPPEIGVTRDYDRIYSELRSGGMSVFFPYFAVNDFVTTFYEYVDFYGKDFGIHKISCSPESPAYAALARHGVRLLLSADVMYPRDEFPTMSNDPLQEILSCAGRSGIYGILTYDEPVLNDVPNADLQRLYDRVNAVDPTIPVLVVNAPMIGVNALGQRVSGAEVNAYFSAVAQTHAYADVVGFDVYPIPESWNQTWATPYRGGAAGPTYRETIDDYARWLAENAGGRSTWMVLQAFTPDPVQQFPILEGPDSNSGQTGVRPPTFDPFGGGLDLGGAGRFEFGCVCGTGLRGPTEEELRTMVQVSLTRGVSVIGWYGATFLSHEAVPVMRTAQGAPSLWESVKQVSRETQPA